MQSALARILCAAPLAALSLSCGGSDGGGVLMGWELDETNTGLGGDYFGLTDFDVDGADAALGTLPEWGTLTINAGITIEDRIIRNELDLTAGGITLRRCLIQPTAVGQGMPLVSAGDAVLEDCEIDGSLIADADIVYNIAYSGTGSIRRCDIHDAASGIYLNNDGAARSVAENNYVHDLRWVSPAHMDGITVRGSTGAGVSILNNRSECGSQDGCTGAFFSQPYNAAIDHMTIEGNLFEGYGYTLYVDNHGNGYGSDLRVVNNRMDPYDGAWGPFAMDDGVALAEFSENYLYDPAAEDAKGAPVEH
jgi:hypothetical protein